LQGTAQGMSALNFTGCIAQRTRLFAVTRMCALVGAVIVGPAALTSTSAMVALDNLVVCPDIAIFAFSQASVATREDLSISGAALEILRHHVHTARSFDRMLAPRDILFDLVIAADLREVLCLVTFQACSHVATQKGNIGDSDVTHLFAFLATWLWT